MKILPVDVFLSSRTDELDDLLVVVNSFERRCFAFLQKISQQHIPYKAKAVACVIYSDRGDLPIRQRAESNLKTLIRLAESASLYKKIYPIHLEPYDVLLPIRSFKNLFSSIPNKSSVVVDISTLPKIHLIYLIDEAVRSKRLSRLRLVYTRARYGKYDALSWGAEEPIILPSFGKPRFSETGKTRLLLFCGLEPERSYCVWRRFGQDRCIRLFIDAGEEDFDRPTSRAIRYNNFDERESPIILPAFRPAEVLAKIKDIYEDCVSTGDHLFIAPFATKWEAYAVWKFFSQSEQQLDASIVYCAPGRLNATGYTVDEWGDLVYSEVGLV